ncbi:LCP family protein [Streptomyces sp. P38-E01]|uniref:LCP family protein n=1 Tax=Streptomyces tardus TaxID=2780544 RepID=A0A949JFR8_9ACTN|nr:LCP family protein [Streptomyces tardus]
MDTAVSDAETGPEGTPHRHPRTVAGADGANSGGSGSDGQGDGRDGGGGRRSGAGRWLRWTAFATSVVILAGAGTGWVMYHRLEGNITTDTATAELLEKYERERPDPEVDGASNILVIGSDDRSGQNRRYGRDNGTARSDTAILLHLSADRDRATAVSLPRDLMVDIPTCDRPDSSRAKGQFAQFNWAYQFGGAACTIRTVEKLTDVRVDHHMVIDFDGFKQLVDSVGGVQVCLPDPVRDRDAKLDLPAGRQTLRGEDALGYVRARQSFGNGSDTDRMARQQDFLASLVRKVRGNGVLMNPAKLFPVLNAATSSVTADSGLNSLTELYDLVRSVRNIPAEEVRFMTVPRQPYRQNPNRDELRQPDAARLFAQLREDRPVHEGGRTGARERNEGARTQSSSPQDPASQSPAPGGYASSPPESGGVCADDD